MNIKKITHRKDEILTPLVLKIPRRIHPNHLSILRAILLIPVGWFLWNQNYFWGGLIFALAFILDALDGTLARATNRITNFGAIFDPTADKFLFLTAFVILGVRLVSLPLLLATVSAEIGVAAISLILAFFAKWRGRPYMRHANSWGKMKTFFQVVGVIFLLFPATVAMGNVFLWVGFGFALGSIWGNMKDGVGAMRV